MSKRTAVVTGGIGGLGTAICIELARAGRSVVAADLGSNPERIARTVAFLSADDADYITGANIPVNGGLYMGF